MNKPPLCLQGRQSIQVCFSEVCPNYPFICCNPDCSCSDKHQDCQFFGLEGFLKKLSTKEPVLQGREKDWVESIRSVFNWMLKTARDELSSFEECLRETLSKQSQSDSNEFTAMLRGSKVKSLKGSTIFRIYKQSRQRTASLDVGNFDTFHKRISLVKRDLEDCIARVRTLYSEPTVRTERSNSKQRHQRSTKKLDRSVKFEDNISQKSTNLSNLLRLSPERALSRMRLSSCHQGEFHMDSVITSDTETLKALFYPQKLESLKLLYRASRHVFSIAKFHQQCDEISETLVLVKSEHGRIIGGFTPLPWRSSDSLKKHSDSSGRSFLFCLAFKERYPLLSKEHAIYCSKHEGPNFGHGPDLVIREDNDRGGKSCMNFPSSYSGLGKY